MQVTVSGHHVSVTEALRSYALKKLERVQKHNRTITSIEMTFNAEKQHYKADARVHVSGLRLFADAQSTDLYEAIDKLADKLDRILIKHRGKLSHRNNSKNHDNQSGHSDADGNVSH